MIAAIHVSELRHWQVAGDAPACFAIGRVMCVRLGIFNPFFVAWHAGMISFSRICKAIATARCMAVYTIQLAALEARAHTPTCHCVIFTQIAPIRIEIRMFERNEIIVVKIFLAGFISCSNRTHLCMAWAAHTVYLIGIKILCAYQPEIFWLFVFQGCFLEMPNVFARRAVACFAIDSRFFPDGVVCVGFQVVVCRKLADVTAKAGSIERKRSFHPI